MTCIHTQCKFWHIELWGQVSPLQYDEDSLDNAVCIYIYSYFYNLSKKKSPFNTPYMCRYINYAICEHLYDVYWMSFRWSNTSGSLLSLLTHANNRTCNKSKVQENAICSSFMLYPQNLKKIQFVSHCALSYKNKIVIISFLLKMN